MGELLQPDKQAIADFSKFLHDYQSQESIVDPKIFETLASNRDIILDMAFSNDNDPLHLKAFILLCNISPALRKEFLTKDRLFIKIARIFSGQEVSELVISRIASVLQSFIFVVPDLSQHALGPLFSLISYIENQAIFDLLSSITSPSHQIQNFTDTLAKLKIDDLLIKELNQNPSEIKKAHIFYIIRNCAKNPSFSELFNTQSIINELNKFLPCKDHLTNGHLWQALSAICSEETYSQMNDILQHAFKIASEPIYEIHMEHTCIWDFLGKMLLYHNDPEFGNEYQLNHMIINLMVQYPNNSNLVGALFRFIRNGLKVPGYATKVISDFVPLMITLIDENDSTAASASSRMFIGDMTVQRRIHPELHKALKTIDMFTDIKETFVDHYFEVLSEDYGGPAPPQPNDGIMTIQQLMHITD